MQKQKSAPKITDFSSNAINKAVYKTGLTHWLTLYPPALGIPVGIAGLLFGSPLVSAVGFGACFLSLGNAVINIFFKNEKIANSYIQELTRKLKEQEALVLESLEANLNQCATIAGAESLAEQGVEQFKNLKVKYQNVQDLLVQKFNKEEMTFGRFMGSAEQVYLSALDNLKKVVSTLQSASSIDLYYVKQKLEELSGNSEQKQSHLKEIDALKKRLALWQEQIQKVNELLADNEEAMTKMEEASAAIASLTTGESFAATDLETAMAQLQDMAKRAPVYNKQ